MSEMKTVHVVFEDYTVENLDYHTEVSWVFNVKPVTPSRVLYRKLWSWSKDGGRVVVYVHGGLGKEPSREFVELFLRTSTYPTFVRFRNGDL